MGRIVIKKRVSFEFLGEDYKDAYLTFRSIPLKDFDELTKKIETAQENHKAASFMLETLKGYFVEGKFPDAEKVEASDLDGLDVEAVVKCFAAFTGQDPDPKVPSPTPSSTAEVPTKS